MMSPPRQVICICNKQSAAGDFLTVKNCCIGADRIIMSYKNTITHHLLETCMLEVIFIFDQAMLALGTKKHFDFHVNKL